MSAKPGASEPTSSWRRWHKDFLGAAWAIGAGVLLILPALVHGSALGSYDLLSTVGLTAHSGVPVHNQANEDQVLAFIPWSTVAWQQVHHGVLPLWNPYAGPGMPLAFNVQSAAFSLPALISYAVPLRLAYTTQVVVTIVVAGTGAYVLSRLLRIGVLGAAFAATVFELSGPVAGWLGWPLTAVMSWAGWLFVAAVLILRGRHRVRSIAFFALIVAFASFAGDPEVLGVLLLALAMYFAVSLVGPIRQRRDIYQAVVRPMIDVVAGAIAGFCLSSPLWLPSWSILRGSVREGIGNPLNSLDSRYLVNLFFQGFFGTPTARSGMFDFDGRANLGYYETVAYVGVVALVLAGVGIWMGRHREGVIPFTCVAVLTLALTFVAPVDRVVSKVTGAITLHRAVLVLAFALAMLSGFGLDLLVRRWRDRAVLYLAGAGFVGVGLLLLAIWGTELGDLNPVQLAQRQKSFVWPIVATLVGIGVVGSLMFLRRQRPNATTARVGTYAGVVLLVCETAFLFAAGAPTWSSASAIPVNDPAAVALSHRVGTSLVGFGGGGCGLEAFASLGIVPNFNAVYQVDELGIYDPAVPRSLFKLPGGAASPFGEVYTFCPPITTVGQARVYGAGFVLEPLGSPGPKGAVFDSRIGNEELYRIKGSSLVTLSTSTNRIRKWPALSAPGTPIRVHRPDPATIRFTTSSRSTGVLRVHVLNVPGWHAYIDGKPLKLEPYAGSMLQAKIPPGHHSVELRYWPATFSMGLVLAALAMLGLLGVLGADWYRRRRRAERFSAPSSVASEGDETLEATAVH